MVELLGNWSSRVYLKLLNKLNLGDQPQQMHKELYKSKKILCLDEEKFLHLCGVMHVVSLHSNCIMASGRNLPGLFVADVESFAERIC